MIRILVVEDDRAFAALVEDWLVGEQHEVTVVHKGSDAWSQLKDPKYDLIIMDWDLPDVKGIDLVSQFRAGGGITPVIMLTGHTAMDDKVDGLDAGANDYLTKPFQWKELSARIRAVLRTQGAEPPLIALGQGNEEVLRAADLAGTALSARYELLEIIGAGASAMVLKARHPGLEKLVAVKTLFPGLFTQEQLEQFEREARAISEVHHDNIATVHDYGLTERGQPYMVMEYIQGETLRENILRDKQLPLESAVAVLIQVCRGLQAAHSSGIIHRDLRPENVLLQGHSKRPDWVKIVDFAIPQLVPPTSLGLTRSGSSVRTANYTAPDRIESVMADARSDVYSLGIMLFEMLTGRAPFEADTAETVMMRAKGEAIETPSRYRDDTLPGMGFDELINKATAKNPDMRHQTVADLLLELEDIESDLMLQRGV